MLKSKLREQEAIAQKYKEEGDILRMSLKQTEDVIEKHNFQVDSEAFVEQFISLKEETQFLLFLYS